MQPQQIVAERQPERIEHRQSIFNVDDNSEPAYARSRKRTPSISNTNGASLAKTTKAIRGGSCGDQSVPVGLREEDLDHHALFEFTQLRRPQFPLSWFTWLRQSRTELYTHALSDQACRQVAVE
ncbi:unnamed protein product [Peronospora belbahrii]|uniref:Uncharacterized protein n=1 Tax=Peronospora belbahrii TaxID=622444 RepID=A0ABN8D3F6_9STRA|nr:unnamed protein product [Peronospora belbahrii]